MSKVLQKRGGLLGVQPLGEQLFQNKRRQVGLGTAAVIGIIIAVAAFVIGTRSEDVLRALGGSQNKNLAGEIDLSSAQELYRKLADEYDGKLDQNALIDGAKRGLVQAAGDPYTVYLTNDEAKQFKADLEGKFSGIGAELGKKDNVLVIIATLDDSPARKSGVMAGDAIIKVNDQDAQDWSIEKAVSEIRGEKGTTVKLTLVRDQTLKEISIVRDEIVNPSVRHEVTADNIGVLRISRFAEGDTTRLATEAAQSFKEKGVKGVLLDLRGNGGGYLTTAQEIASLWLKDKVVVQERRGDTVIDTLKTQGTPLLEGMPTVVLIDGGSASASEIVAGALSDHGAAQLVGIKSYGKGSVQRIVELSSGQLKVTTARWFTPNGKNISKEGIEPATKVEISSEDISAGRDPQKTKALELLQ